MGTPVYHTLNEIPVICYSDADIPEVRPEEEYDITLRILRTEIDDISLLCSNLQDRINIINGNPVMNLTDFEKLSVQAVSSFYALDKDPEKVNELRNALYEVWYKAYEKRCTGWCMTDGITDSVKYILEKTIVCGDFDTGLTPDGNPIILSEWCHFHRVKFNRVDIRLSDVKQGIYSEYRKYPWMDYSRIHKITKPEKIDGTVCE